MKPHDEYVPLFPLLADYWGKPFAELPEALQARVSIEFIVGWDRLTPEQRRTVVSQIDYQNDPAQKSEMNAGMNLGYWSVVARSVGSIGDWDYWASQKYLTPREIACLMFEFDQKYFDNIHFSGNTHLQAGGLADEIDKIERSATRDTEDAKLSPEEWIEWAQGKGYAVPEKFIKAVAEHAPAAKVIAVADITPAPVKQMNKLKTNTLDPAIDKAIELAGCTTLAYVYLQLKELALSSEIPFTGAIDGDALCYTNDNDEPKKLTKNALGKRLKRR